jgi:2-polyprenyl-3-methyl-5-hydroxy-6-metoxy-1,4-benzoquinol methylase
MIKVQRCTVNTDILIYDEYTLENEQSSFNSIKDDNYIFGRLESNLCFKSHVYNLFQKKIKVLEIGCGGGQVIVDFLNDGNEIFGIDARPGYNLYKEYAPNWKKYRDKFAVFDAAQPFELVNENNIIVEFDLITSWECFEHIYEPCIDQLMKNIFLHSHKDSYFIGSISHDTNETNHRCIKPREWWLNKFYSIGFEETDLNFGQDIPRHLPHINYVFYLQRKV